MRRGQRPERELSGGIQDVHNATLKGRRRASREGANLHSQAGVVPLAATRNGTCSLAAVFATTRQPSATELTTP